MCFMSILVVSQRAARCDKCLFWLLKVHIFPIRIVPWQASRAQRRKILLDCACHFLKHNSVSSSAEMKSIFQEKRKRLLFCEDSGMEIDARSTARTCCLDAALCIPPSHVAEARAGGPLRFVQRWRRDDNDSSEGETFTDSLN